ncbi:intersectin-EH binding protein Ibp1 [Mycolicibacterium phlei]|jgi:hypothetical protein|uniref:hypothetical protein n=1 Tax=Mycolicibacterium phlei TaxID=1771 RepID=UPI0006810DBD|nr:hypothetical protein [Mycolicibacterium phlei]AMO59455.1 hypothetical protein MPHLCCUG_00617 [Mycolicibacterium phlei]STZ15899.1 intersectin-EH binding protein Ibp1 [Mycolicibacterium phlei]VEG07585.1 intersectin-EH binding protein Ibp1 [Mycobacteroides chelonae]
MLNSACQRVASIGGLVAAVATPALVLIATPDPAPAVAQGCSSGEEMDVYTTTCTPFLVPRSPQLFSVTAANPDMPEIDGIPCFGGHHQGECIGLAEEAEAQGPPAQPRVTISSSP